MSSHRLLLPGSSSRGAQPKQSMSARVAIQSLHTHHPESKAKEVLQNCEAEANHLTKSRGESHASHFKVHPSQHLLDSAVGQSLSKLLDNMHLLGQETKLKETNTSWTRWGQTTSTPRRGHLVASLLLVVRPGAPSSVLAPSSDARSP